MVTPVWHVLAGTGGRRSLKTQQHAGVDLRPTPLELPSSQGDALTAAIQPGSVDMLGPIRLDIAVPRGLGDRADPSCDGSWIGAPLGAP
jgi:hypothetical protein